VTPRERLLAALRGQPVDRVPVWLLFPYHPTGYYVDVRTNPCYVPIFEKSKQCAVMLDRRSPRAPLFAPDVTDQHQEGTEAGWRFNRRVLSYRGRQLVSETRCRGTEVRVKKLLESEADLDTLLTFPVNDDPRRVAATLDRQAVRYFAERDEFPLEYGAMMLDLGEPIGFLYHNTNLEEYALWSLACSDKVVAFLDRAMRHYRLEYEYWLKRAAADRQLHTPGGVRGRGRPDDAHRQHSIRSFPVAHAGTDAGGSGAGFGGDPRPAVYSFADGRALRGTNPAAAD
jgi:hypothetical protein